MSYLNLFKQKLNNLFIDLSHVLINYLFGIIVKRERQINKNCYLNIYKKNKNIVFFIKDVSYVNRFLTNSETKNIKLKINNSFMPYLTIDSLDIDPKLDDIVNLKKSYKFRPWLNCSKNVYKDINRVNSVLKHLTSFINLKIKNLSINIGSFKLKIYNLVVIKNNNKIIIKISKIVVIHNNLHILKLKKVKLNIYSEKYISSIYIRDGTFNLREKNIRNNLFEEVINITNIFIQGEKGVYPKVFINRLIFNLEVHNYIRLDLGIIVFEKNKLSISTINSKVFKKEILWINNFKFNVNEKQPFIKSVRLRLFKSTGDKLYKSFIFLRKRYIHYDNIRKKILISDTDKISNIDNNYLKNLSNLRIKSENNEISQKISVKESYLQNYILDVEKFKVYIKQLEISFEKDWGKFLINDFEFKKLQNNTEIICTRWLFFKDNIKYLDKIGNDKNFKIKLGNGIFEIFPYKCYINLDLDLFKSSFSILINNISKVISIFSQNIGQTKNYIFEKFRIESFYLVLSYTKNNFSIGNLFDGNYSEILNLISINDVELLLPELIVLYPNNWSEISKKIINKYFLFMSKKNMKNIIKKTPAAPILKLDKIKSSIGYISKKIYGSF